MSNRFNELKINDRLNFGVGSGQILDPNSLCYLDWYRSFNNNLEKKKMSNASQGGSFND